MSELRDDSAALAAAASESVAAAEVVLDRARAVLLEMIEAEGGGPAAVALQHPSHAYAWLATVLAGLRAGRDWIAGRVGEGAFGEIERDLAVVGFGEYLAQFSGGVPMSQGETARLGVFGLATEGAALAAAAPVEALVRAGEEGHSHRRLAGAMADMAGGDLLGADGLDEELAMVRDQFRRFSAERIRPHAHGWHLADALLPEDVLGELAELGVFGLTIPERYGGVGSGKVAMCVVSEELSRGFLGAGSLATRSEIAGELILSSGTEEQRLRWLPEIAAGAVLPTAVFTEPDTGSDLGALATRAGREGDVWRITGSKTWITHAARADLMTVLVRTVPGVQDHRGLSILLAPKTRGREGEDFPDPGMEGSEIAVLGYRGMKEYALSFDGFEVEADGLLGGVEGEGFRQLMQTFESARIQTGARAVGVALSALDLGLAYACERRQFGRSLLEFPRVHRKLAMIAAETCITRQLTYAAARAKDAGRRCDLEAGMAKLLAARVAWAAADNALQIHGGNGYALEFPISRVLCDARVLNIFEGAGEVQAMVIARRLLERRN